ncbi:MAG TPA: hypothetical protein PK869_03550 [Candidatus Hydrogenedentes bacterium]|nr:hypothetical protein [Candidatus Hydrogenedentota bacterium]
MITINLLPHHLRPIKRTPLPYIAVAAVAVLALAYIGYSFMSAQWQVMALNNELAKNKADLEAKKAIVEESNQLEKTKLALAEKITTIQEIASNRIVWSRQLFNLSRLKPPNFWYSEVLESTKSYPVQEQVIDPKTGKPKVNEQTKKIETKIVNVTRPILRVSGYVVSTDDGRSDVSPLTDALTTDPEFTSMFVMEPPSFSDTDFEGFPVKKFTLEFQISPEGETPR